jgi:hypothetical protein
VSAARANRTGRPRGAAYTSRQLDAALTGRLTRGNTQAGSPTRSAVYRAAYLRRVEHAEQHGYSRSQARGHPGRGLVRLSEVTYDFFAVPTTDGVADVTVTSSREARRVGQYLRDVRDLLEDHIDAKAFGRKWRRRIRTAGDHELEPDAEAVIVMVFQAGPGPSERYRRLDARAAS